VRLVHIPAGSHFCEDLIPVAVTQAGHLNNLAIVVKVNQLPAQAGIRRSLRRAVALNASPSATGGIAVEEGTCFARLLELRPVHIIRRCRRNRVPQHLRAVSCRVFSRRVRHLDPLPVTRCSELSSRLDRISPVRNQNPHRLPCHSLDVAREGISKRIGNGQPAVISAGAYASRRIDLHGVRAPPLLAPCFFNGYSRAYCRPVLFKVWVRKSRILDLIDSRFRVNHIEFLVR